MHILFFKKTDLNKAKEQDKERRRSNKSLGEKSKRIITIDDTPGSSYEIEIVVVPVFLSGSWLQCRAIK